jgi:PAS domain-containing protein
MFELYVKSSSKQKGVMNSLTKVERLYFEMNQFKLAVSDSELVESCMEKAICSEYAGFVVVDKTDKTQVWSPQFYKALGYEVNEFTPSFDQFEIITHPSDFALLKEILNDNKRFLNEVLSVKLRFKTKSNTYILFSTSATIIHANEYALC